MFDKKKYEISVMDFLNEIEDMNSFAGKQLKINISRIKYWNYTDIPTLNDINMIKSNMNKLLEKPINITNSDQKYNINFVDSIREKILEYFNEIGKLERRIIGNLTLGKDEFIL